METPAKYTEDEIRQILAKLDDTDTYGIILRSKGMVPDPEGRRPRQLLSGELPSPLSLPSGCPFHPRCRYARALCREVMPSWEEKRPGHFAACHFSSEVGNREV